MKLSIKDRLMIPAMLPESSNLHDQLVAKDINEKIKFDLEELEEMEFVQEENKGMRWNAEKAKDLEVEFSSAEINLLKSVVEKLDKEERINKDNVSLCLAFKDL